jgi:hypothetical protein
MLIRAGLVRPALQIQRTEDLIYHERRPDYGFKYAKHAGPEPGCVLYKINGSSDNGKKISPAQEAVIIAMMMAALFLLIGFFSHTFLLFN